MIFNKIGDEENLTAFKKQRKAFSLLELVVVAALISVIIVSVIPSVNTMTEDQKKFITKSTLKSVYDSVLAYYTSSHPNPSQQITPLEYFPDPIKELISKNLLNEKPVDAWKNDMNFFISSSTISSMIFTGTIEIGDGSTTNFTFSIYAPTDKSIIPNTFTAYTIDPTSNQITQEVTDDGSGSLTGTAGSGTIDYKTGDINLTFNIAPGNNEPIMCTYRINVYGGSFAFTGISAGPDKKFGNGDDIIFSSKKTTF